jgi:hypothetical protein
MKLWHEFWTEQNGAFLNSAELILLGSILVIGIIPGIATLRDAIVTEMADMAEAVTGGQSGDLEQTAPTGEQISVCSDLFGG